MRIIGSKANFNTNYSEFYELHEFFKELIATLYSCKGSTAYKEKFV
jgi:hypothetical protein